MRYARTIVALAMVLTMMPAAGARAGERNTSVDVDADPPVVPEEVRAAIAKAQEFLRKEQKEDGSIGGGVAHTALGTLALMVDGSVPGYGPYGREVAKGMKYLLSQARPSGLLAKETKGRGGIMYHHGLATLCLAEIWGMTGDPEVRPVLKRAVDLIIRCQNDKGGWRYDPKPKDADLSVTVMQIVALRASQNAGIAVPQETIEKAVKYVKGLHVEKEGGFGYASAKSAAPPRSAAGVISLQLCGEYECKEVEKGLEYLWKLSDKDFKKVEKFPYYFQYYAMQAMYQSRDAEKWQEWYPKACTYLMKKQKKHGEIGSVYQTGFAILAMGLPYRFLPIYQR